MKTTPATTSLNRRTFLKTAAVSTLLAPAIIPGRALGLDGGVAASDRIVLGVLGTGPRSRVVLSSMLPERDVQCVAVCDVQRSRVTQGKQQVDDHYRNDDCVVYQDMHELLARKDIDAVLVATGDRWHAMAAVLCASAGKDVYCEKPSAMTMGQAQDLEQAITRMGRVFQCGTQRRSQANFRYAIQLAHTGRLGQLRTLHASVYVPKISYDWLPEQPEPPKSECDWDRWLGPSLWRPFNKAYLPGGWRGFFDMEAGGNFLDWGAHTLDLCQWANQADHTAPTEYEANATSIHARYANGVKLVCDFLPDAFGNRDPQYRTSTGTCPVRFEGDEGWVETGDNGEIALSQKLQRTLARRFEAPGQNPVGHARDFFDCMRTRALPICSQHTMRRSHVACFAAAMSWELGRKLVFDPVKEEFEDDPEANRLRRRPMREPWRI